MKPAIFGALMFFVVVNASDARAWTYVLVDRHGNQSFSSAAPRDMTYPPDNVRVEALDVATGTPPQGTPQTAQQERLRMNADMLIITDATLAPPGKQVGWAK